jgi:hypothetical protein
MRRTAAILAGCLVPLCIAALALHGAAGPTTKPSYANVLIKDVPHVRQKPDFCGEACAEMVLRKLGFMMDQDWVFDQSGVEPILGRGCYTAELANALKKIGFKVGRVWSSVSAAKAAQGLEAQFRAMHADLTKGVASIVCMRTSEATKAGEHFRLVLGYDAKDDAVIYHEPAEAGGAYRRMKRDLFLKHWPLKYDASRWTVIRLRLEPGRIRRARPAAGFTDADYAQHIRRLRKKVPKQGFTIVIQRPFVVIGDEKPATVRRRARRTVKWAVDLLKKDYFEKDPAEILDIWLFKDKASYRKHTKAIFGHNPTTPFGYYSPAAKAMIMNIETGGGTLVHEIVHPFVAANFPECPAWFNEGMGSLYEQCREKDGHIHGETNWRLAGLQRAIRNGKVPSFKALCSTTTHQFYRCDPGTNYGQARYLCYYLQQRDLLRKYYRAFRANHKTDPGGYETLRKVLGEEDMDAFKKRWEAFVLSLRFP